MTSLKSSKQVPHYNQIKSYIYAVCTLGVIITGIALNCILNQDMPRWLISVGFVLAGVSFIILGFMLRKYPALFSSSFTKCSRHSKDDNTYDK